MKADKHQIERALDRPGTEFRCVLLYGPDESGSLLLADRIGKALGAEAERIDLDGATVKADPARLADEAASISLFGGARWIRVRASGDEAAVALEALLALPQAGNPVALVTGPLKPASKLLKLALASPMVAAFASYPADARDAVPIVIALAAPLHLRLSPDLAQRVFDTAAGERAVIARELEKLALFVDADAERPVTLTAEALDALSAGEGESSSMALIDAALTGRVRDAVEELRVVTDAGEHGVPLVRAALRRLALLAALSVEADRTGPKAAIEAVGKALFWKEKPSVEAALRRWRPADLVRLVARMTEAQAKLLESSAPGPVTASQELLTIARAAARAGR